MASDESPDPPHLEQHGEINYTSLGSNVEDEAPQSPSIANLDINPDLKESPVSMQHRKFLENRGCTLPLVSTSNSLPLPIPQLDFIDDTGFSFAPLHQKLNFSSSAREAEPLKQDLSRPQPFPMTTSSARSLENHLPTSQFEPIKPQEMERKMERKMEMDSPRHGNHHDLAPEEQQTSDSPLDASNIHHGPVPVQAVPAESNRVVDLTQSPAAINPARSNQTPNRTMPALSATILHGRISKGPRQGPSQCRNTHLPRGPRAMRQPSEEDLLFLLLSRVRKTDIALKRLEHLEHENEDLQLERVQTNAKLQQAISAHNECARKSSFLSDNMAKFKEKYYKLKNWAFEANRDCEELQQKASGFERTLVDLTDDRDQLFTQLQDIKASTGSASTQLENVRKGIRETKLMANDCITSSNILNSIVIEKDDGLRKQEQRCRKLDVHIVHLEKERDMQNVRMHKQQQQLQQTLQFVFEKLQLIENGKLEQTAENDCIIEELSRIESTLNGVLDKPQDFGPLEESLQTTATSLSAMITSTTEKLLNAVTKSREDLQHHSSADLARLLSAVTDVGSLLETEAEVARLKEKDLQTEKRVELLQNAKAAAEERVTSLKKTTDRTVDALIRENEALQKQTSDIATTSSELRIKWQAVSSQLEKCKREKLEVEQGREELNAELNDLLCLLAEATEEERSLRSTLSNSEDDSKKVIIEIEQHCHETVARMDCQIRHLQNDLDHEIQVQAELKERFDMEMRCRDWLLDESSHEIEVAMRDQLALQAEIADLEQRLACAEDCAKTLDQAASDLKAATIETQKLKEKSLSHSKELEANSLEVQSLRKDLGKACTKATLLEFQVSQKEEMAAQNAAIRQELEQLQPKASMAADLQNELEEKNNEVAKLQTSLATAQQQVQENIRLSKENAAIKVQVQTLREKLLVLPDLQKRLQQKENHMSDLQAALRASQQQAQEKDKLIRENAIMAERLRQTEGQIFRLQNTETELQQERARSIMFENDLAAAKTQATQVDEVREKVVSLQEQCTSLTSELERSTEQCAQILPLKQSIKEKDDELAGFREQSVTLQAQAGDIQSLKDDLRQAEEKHSSMQQQILRLEGELSNARLDIAGNESPRQRRIANRSGGFSLPAINVPRRPVPPVDHESVLSNGDGFSEVANSSLPPSGVTEIVPETQPEIQESPLVEGDSILPTFGQQQSSDPEPSFLPSDDEDSSPENESLHLNIETRRPLVDMERRVVDQEAGETERMQERPPSSSYESQSDQMLLDQVSQGENDGLDQLPSTTTPKFAMPSSQIISGQEQSPRRLRSGSRGLGRQATRSVEPDYPHQRTRVSTPTVRREQYQPNSAAKRRIEPDVEEEISQENPRKLKRRPANMEIKKPQVVVPKQPEKQTPSRGMVSFRKTSNSIVGTNAPAPGKSQRSSKPARKGSRQDRYTTRFGPDTDGNET